MSAGTYGKGADMQQVPKFVADALDEAERLGREHGNAAASWVEIQGTEDARSITGDIDPEVLDRYDPSPPLSGEWADGMTLGRLYSEVGIEDSDAWIPEDLDTIATVYEDAYRESYWHEVDRMASAMLSQVGNVALAVAVVLMVVVPALTFVVRVLSEVAEVLGS